MCHGGTLSSHGGKSICEFLRSSGPEKKLAWGHLPPEVGSCRYQRPGSESRRGPWEKTVFSWHLDQLFRLSLGSKVGKLVTIHSRFWASHFQSHPSGYCPGSFGGPRNLRGNCCGSKHIPANRPPGGVVIAGADFWDFILNHTRYPNLSSEKSGKKCTD